MTSPSFSVWKFQVQLLDDFTITMPAGARLLTIEEQHKMPMMWAVVEVDAPKVKRRFRLIGTGHPADATIAFASYVGSVLLHDGALVFHLFDLGEEK